MSEPDAEDLPEPIRRIVVALAEGMARADHEAGMRRRAEGEHAEPGRDPLKPAGERRSPG